MKMWRDLVAEAKREVPLLQVKDVQEKIERGEAFTLIDVREADEFQAGRVPKSRNIPRGILEMEMERHFKDATQPVILYCAAGGRSAVAAQVLKNMGYENVSSMEGGFETWRRLGLPVER